MTNAFTNVDRDALNLTRAIALSESGQDGKPNYNASGKSGERGAYQWMSGNFESAAKEAGLDPTDFSPQNQDKVAYYQVKKYKDMGYQPWEIASLWNSGSPDNWKDHRGVNKYGVQYDTPAYVNRVKQHYLALAGGGAVQPQQPQEQDVLTGLGDKLAGRVQDIADTFQQPSLARGLLRTGGAIAGGINDIAGAAVSAITPDFIEKPVMQAVGGVVQGAMETPVGQSITQAYESLDPEVRKDIGAAGNIATLLPVLKGGGIFAKGVAETVPTATRIAAKTPGLIGQAAQRSLVNEALEIVSPKGTSKVLKKGIKSGRGEVSGTFGEATVAPDARTLRAAEASAGIVKKGKTYIENANALRAEIKKQAVKLEDDLDSMEFTPIVQPEDLNKIINRALKEIGENPTLVGNAELSARRILDKFKSFLPKGKELTAKDILKARKDLDAWIENLEGGGRVFDPSYESAKSIALRAVRQSANDLIAEKAPSVAVKESLARQSALYDALENVSAKGASEVGTNAVERFIQARPVTTGLIKGAGQAIGTGLGIGSVSNLLIK